MPLFTRETAAIHGKAGAIARWTKPPPEPEPVKPPPMPEPIAPANPFVQSRLDRVRAQLDLIDSRIKEQCEKEIPDGQTLNWLCSAQARLSEQERQLAGRPMPGSLKPASPRSKDRNDWGSLASLTQEPEPAKPAPSSTRAEPDTTSGSGAGI